MHTAKNISGIKKVINYRVCNFYFFVYAGFVTIILLQYGFYYLCLWQQ